MMETVKGRLVKDGRGFTLIEMVVTIAIMGILAAIAVPVVTGYLGSSKEQSYEGDLNAIQAAVDGYYSAPDNTRFAGQRQYPLLANAKALTSGGTTEAISIGTTTAITISVSTVGGTIGNTPHWDDDTTGDGLRQTGSEILIYHNVAPGAGGEHWNTTAVTPKNSPTVFVSDSRDWFIDFDELVTAGYLAKRPDSASLDNLAGLAGTYSWYVDSAGEVRSLYAFFPVSNVSGYQDIYP